jgi:hypothetical protein
VQLGRPQKNNIITHKSTGTKLKNEQIFQKTYPTLFVQEIKNPQPGLDQIDTWLIVVEIYHLPLDSLLKNNGSSSTP